MATWAERHLVNRAVRIGVRLGRDIDGVQGLEVRGRRTGKPRRTPVKVLEVDGERYVVSLSGDSGPDDRRLHVIGGPARECRTPTRGGAPPRSSSSA